MTVPVLVAFAVSYLAARAWLVLWGATRDERDGAMAGDAILADAQSSTTHAITIDAPPEDVWPWLVQIGQGRGGFYSYAAFENLFGAHMRNADRIVPELQTLVVGDAIPIHPRAAPYLVAEIDAPQTLVLRGDEGLVAGTTWAFEVRAAENETSRFVARMRVQAPGNGVARALRRALTWLVLEPGHGLMERRMLKGLADRASRDPRRSQSCPES